MISIPVFNQWINDDPEDKPPVGYVVDGFTIGWGDSHHRTDLLVRMQNDMPSVFEALEAHNLKPKMVIRPTFLKDNPVWNGWVAVLYFEFENDGEGVFFNFLYQQACDEMVDD